MCNATTGGYAATAELLKLRKRPATRIIVGIWPALNLSFAYLFPYLSYRTGTPTGMLGALAGIAFRGTSLAIGLGLVWALVIENLIRGTAALVDVFDTVQRTLPGVNAGSLVAALGAGRDTPGVAAVVGGTQAAVVLACYAVGFVLVAGTLLARRDVA